jgi:hypothetical protein
MQKEQLGKPSHERHLYLMKGLPGRRRFCTGVAGRRNSGIDERRDENVTDTRTPAGEAVRGESTVAPCPLPAVRANIANTNSGLAIAWCAGC